MDVVPENNLSGGVGGHWSRMARHWGQVGAPLRPSPEDVSFVRQTVLEWCRGNQEPPRTLVLGSTPELYAPGWPTGTSVLALDHTPEMLEHVWPGPRNTAVCGDWTDPPLRDACRDIVVCDGGLHLLSPTGQKALVAAVARVVSPGGFAVLRLFVTPPRRESVPAVMDDLLSGRIANLNILKLRLGAALQEDPDGGVELHHVWSVLAAAAPDFGHLARRAGWPEQHFAGIESYRNCRSRYHFRSTEAAIALFCEKSGRFELAALHVPTYALGERCPTVAFRRACGPRV